MESRLNQTKPLIEELFELSCSPGLSVGVLHEGRSVFTTHLGRCRISEPQRPNDDTLYNLASFTKLMTAGVVANLVAQGLLEWDAPIRHYLPEFGERKDDIGQKASVADFLANRSGLSAQATFWGVMKEDILPDREQIPRLACHIPAIGEFRNSFIYSTWGYGLVTSAIERVTGKPFSVCVEEYIFRPLGMARSTTNLPKVDNVAFKHWVGTDGIAHEFPWSAHRGWSDETGFGGAVGARSTTSELLIMYRSLLHAYDHQRKFNVDITPGSPFNYARRILSPHIGVANAALEKQGYCLGTYRSELPANISAASYNSLLLQKKNDSPFGESNAGRVIFHQQASFTGYNGSMLLDPQTQTAIFVVVNSLPLFDITDIVGKILLGTILGETDRLDHIGLAKSVRAVNLSLYDFYLQALQSKKTSTSPTHPLKHYEGDYWDEGGIICYSVSNDADNQLRVSVRGSQLTTYVLDHWGGDTFCFIPNRDSEIPQSMWPFNPLKQRLFFFRCNKNGVSAFTWHHDITPGSKPETFFKHPETHTANL